MQKILATLAILLSSVSIVLAQDTTPAKMNENATPSPISKPGRDFLMVNFLYFNWLNQPDTVKVKTFGYSFHASLCYDFPIKKTKLSFAAGLGINTSVVYLNQEVMRNTDTFTSNGYNSEVHFRPDTVGFKRYKFVTTYLMAPFELRYYSNTDNRNKAWKAAIGLEVGTLLGAHTKATTSVDNAVVKYKVDTKRYVTPWNFAATARVGYGNFSLFGSYNLTNVFKDNAGPKITPFSVGICLTGL